MYPSGGSYPSSVFSFYFHFIWNIIAGKPASQCPYLTSVPDDHSFFKIKPKYLFLPRRTTWVLTFAMTRHANCVANGSSINGIKYQVALNLFVVESLVVNFPPILSDDASPKRCCDCCSCGMHSCCCHNS